MREGRALQTTCRTRTQKKRQAGALLAFVTAVGSDARGSADFHRLLLTSALAPARVCCRPSRSAGMLLSPLYLFVDGAKAVMRARSQPRSVRRSALLVACRIINLGDAPPPPQRRTTGGGSCASTGHWGSPGTASCSYLGTAGACRGCCRGPPTSWCRASSPRRAP
jgi:hypothetical protein